MRLFVAIELTESVKDALCASMEYLRRRGIEGGYTRRENLHLTLAFIGESDRVDDAVRAMNSISVKPFLIKLNGSGYFGDLLWAGVGHCPALEQLANCVAQALRDEGFNIEHRRFVPHITLVRRISQNAHNIRLRITQAKMTVRNVTLMRSDRVEGRLIYTPVYARRF